jgi:hypothetical protein
MVAEPRQSAETGTEIRFTGGEIMIKLGNIECCGYALYVDTDDREKADIVVEALRDIIIRQSELMPDWFYRRMAKERLGT